MNEEKSINDLKNNMNEENFTNDLKNNMKEGNFTNDLQHNMKEGIQDYTQDNVEKDIENKNTPLTQKQLKHFSLFFLLSTPTFISQHVNYLCSQYSGTELRMQLIKHYGHCSNINTVFDDIIIILRKHSDSGGHKSRYFMNQESVLEKTIGQPTFFRRQQDPISERWGIETFKRKQLNTHYLTSDFGFNHSEFSYVIDNQCFNLKYFNSPPLPLNPGAECNLSVKQKLGIIDHNFVHWDVYAGTALKGEVFSMLNTETLVVGRGLDVGNMFGFNIRVHKLKLGFEYTRANGWEILFEPDLLEVMRPESYHQVHNQKGIIQTFKLELEALEAKNFHPYVSAPDTEKIIQCFENDIKEKVVEYHVSPKLHAQISKAAQNYFNAVNGIKPSQGLSFEDERVIKAVLTHPDFDTKYEHYYTKFRIHQNRNRARLTSENRNRARLTSENTQQSRCIASVGPETDFYRHIPSGQSSSVVIGSFFVWVALVFGAPWVLEAIKEKIFSKKNRTKKKS